MKSKWLILFSIILVSSVFLKIPARAVEIRPFTGQSISQHQSTPISQNLARAGLSPQIWDKYSLLKRICATESNTGPNTDPEQFEHDGSPLWGWDVDPLHPGQYIQIKRDVGACQINTKAHAEEIAALQLDVIHSFADNVNYAKILFDREGWKPWTASKYHWDPQGSIH